MAVLIAGTRADSLLYNSTIACPDGIVIDIWPDGVYINDKDNELVCWVEDEWLEDPESVVPAMLNALTLAMTNPQELRQILGKES